MNIMQTNNYKTDLNWHQFDIEPGVQEILIIYFNKTYGYNIFLKFNGNYKYQDVLLPTKITFFQERV